MQQEKRLGKAYKRDTREDKYKIGERNNNRRETIQERDMSVGRLENSQTGESVGGEKLRKGREERDKREHRRDRKNDRGKIH